MKDVNQNLNLEALKGIAFKQPTFIQSTTTVKTQLFKRVSDRNELINLNRAIASHTNNNYAIAPRYMSPRNQRMYLQSQINQLSREIQQIQVQLRQQQQLLNYKEAKLQQQEQKYTSLDQAIRQTSAEFNSALDTIQQVTQQLQQDVAQKQQRAMYQAMANYDQEKDGDFSAYYQKALKGVVADGAITKTLQSLSQIPAQYIAQLGNLGMQLNTVGQALQTTKSEVSEIHANMQALRTTQMAKGVRIKQLKQQLRYPCLQYMQRNEFAMMRYHKINMYQQMNDGYSRFVLLMDKNNQFHMYDRMAQNGVFAPAVFGLQNPAFMQFQNQPWMNMGIDMNNFQIGQGNQTMLWLDQFGQVNQTQAQYSYMPLAVDTNHDGLQMKETYTMYDIDGNGQKELVRDAGDAVIVFDKDGDGISGADGSETLGKFTDLDGDGIADGYTSGMEALRALATKAGIDPNKNLDQYDIAYLERTYGLKVKMNGYNSEAQSLRSAGIYNLRTNTEVQYTTDKYGFNAARHDQYNVSGAYTYNGYTEMGDVNETTVQNQNLGYINPSILADVNNLAKPNADEVDVNTQELQEMIAQDTQRGLEVLQQAKQKLKDYNA